jgi:hypothetical protein
MHLLYVDESGDTGRHNPQNHTFVLCGLMIHHADWHEARSDLLEMRSRMEQIFGLPKAAEIHASELLGRSPSRFGLDRTARIKAALHQVEMIRRQGSLFAVRVIVDKRRFRGDILTTAWHQVAGGWIRCRSLWPWSPSFWISLLDETQGPAIFSKPATCWPI